MSSTTDNLEGNNNGGATPQTVIDKIRKLFALAGNNPSEQEAAAAMAKAQELLAKHNMTMAQLDQAKQTAGKQTTDAAPRGKVKVERSAMFKYQRDIWSALAEANFCFYWSVKQFHESGIYSTHHHFLIGREDNVETIKLMGEYLEKTINRLCPYKSGKDVHLWKLGAVERLCERIKESAQHEDQVSEATSTTALVLTDIRQREVHENYKVYQPEGTWCPCRKCAAERSARWAAERAKKIEEEKMKQGQTITVNEPVKRESESARRRREQAEANSSRRYWDKWEKEQRKERETRGSEAFQRGQKDAEDIGIRRQTK